MTKRSGDLRQCLRPRRTSHSPRLATTHGYNLQRSTSYSAVKLSLIHEARSQTFVLYSLILEHSYKARTNSMASLWNTQVRRWDTSSCNGGLKWQIFDFNKGYNYKNSVSNGAFFQLSARLARFTGNQTYVDWANKVYNWTSDLGLIDPDYHIFDGSDDTLNCTQFDKIIWTYNTAIFMYGSAVLYNYTNGSSLWAERTQGFLNASMNFFSPYKNSTNIMYEPACETVNTCNTDQFSFKGYLSRFMWATTLLAPFTFNTITTLLTTSSQAAAKSCSGKSVV